MKKPHKKKPLKKVKQQHESGNVYIPPEIEVAEEKRDVDNNEK